MPISLVTLIVIRVISALMVNSTRRAAGRSTFIPILIAFLFPLPALVVYVGVPKLFSSTQNLFQNPLKQQIADINKTAEASIVKLQEKAKTNIALLSKLDSAIAKIDDQRMRLITEAANKAGVDVGDRLLAQGLSAGQWKSFKARRAKAAIQGEGRKARAEDLSASHSLVIPSRAAVSAQTESEYQSIGRHR